MSQYSGGLQRALDQQATRSVEGDPSTKNANEPDTTSSAYDAQVKDMVFVRDVYNGTRRMRERSTTYLPQHPREEQQEYDRRVARTVFYNCFKRTVSGLNGMVFRRDPMLDEEVDEMIREQMKDVDLAGRPLAVFAKDLFECCLIDGHAFIHIDAPTITPGREREVTGTLADVKRSGRRPWWMVRSKAEVPFFRWKYEDGRIVITKAVLIDDEIEEDGEFGEKLVERRRELTPGAWKVWRKRDTETSGSGNRWFIEKEGTTSIGVVPLVPVYANRTGVAMSVPPLLDLAYENVDHFQVRSDHRHALSFASIPLPVFIGQKKENIEWGSNRAIFLPSPEAKAQMLESSGAAIGHSREELRDIEARMAILGLQMLLGRPTTQPQTATSEVIDKAESDSELKTAARSLESGLNHALRIQHEYQGKEPSGDVQVNMEFSQLKITPSLVGEVSKMVEKNQLKVETMWSILQEFELLPEDFDPEVEAADLESQGAALLAAFAQQAALTDDEGEQDGERQDEGEDS